MDPKHLPSKIERASIDVILGRYTDLLPSKLIELDRQRYVVIPKAVQVRREDGDAHLTREEVLTLVDWKLPKLRALAAANTNIPAVTREAFAVIAQVDKGDAQTASKKPEEALKVLTSLSGIGPATASLLMSTFDQGRIPFFSDEIYRWITYEDGSTDKGTAWSKKIGYTAKEYRILLEGVGDIRKRFNVKAVELERVAWVLGKEAAGSLKSTAPVRASNEATPAAAPAATPLVSRHTKRTSEGVEVNESDEQREVETQDANLDKHETRSSKRLKSRK